MNTLRTLGRMSLGIAVLGIAWTATASSQGRSSGRSRTPDEANRTVVTPTPTPSPVRDIGRTRRPEAGSPTEVPPGSSGGDRSNRGGASPGAGRETPPPRVERQPANQPSRHDSPHLPPPPPPVYCGGEIEVRGGIPAVSAGIWIREGVTFGRNVTLCDTRAMPEYSGYDFSDLLKRAFDDPFTDMAVESDPWGDLHMLVREDTEIMDLGVVGVPADVIYIPRREWSTDHSVRLDEGHEYVVRTWDGYYAKFVVTSLLGDRVTFDWAYQYGGGTLAYYPAAHVREERFMRFGR